jgi:CelD/BcsL family acetyltransferase involved in cellulose biosynthesis
MMPENLRVTTIRDWEEIWSPEFQHEWLDLFSNCTHLINASPFAHPSVVRAWTKTFNRREDFEPYFIIVRRNGTSCALFPLILMKPRWQRGFLKRLTPVGERYFDYHDPIMSDQISSATDMDDVLRLVWQSILSRHGKDYDCLEIPRWRQRNNLFDWKTTDRSPAVNLKSYPSMPEYLSSRRKSLRNDIHRQIKRASHHGRLSLEESDSSPINVQLEWAKDIRKHRDKRFPNSVLPNSYLENLVEESTLGPVHLSALYLDGKPISWHLGFETSTHHYWYLPTFDVSFSEISPGKLHIYFALERAYEKELEVFDFMRGQESYKSGWTDGLMYESVGSKYGPKTLKGYCKSLLADSLNTTNRLKIKLKEHL